MEKQRRLVHLIQEEVKAQLKRYAMSKTREAFINSLVDELAPALSHHYRAILGIINNRMDQVEKWQQQAEGFLSQFSIQLVKPTKAKRLDIKKAVEQALKELMQKDDARRRIENSKFQSGYKLKKVISLPENAHEDFLVRVWETVTTMFPS